MLGEARIIVAAEIGSPSRERLQEAMLTAFGGWTLTEGWGKWEGPNGPEEEAVLIYDVALPSHTWGRLTDIVHKALEYMTPRQRAVYMRLPNGEVEIINAHMDAFAT